MLQEIIAIIIVMLVVGIAIYKKISRQSASHHCSGCASIKGCQSRNQ